MKRESNNLIPALALVVAALLLLLGGVAHAGGGAKPTGGFVDPKDPVYPQPSHLVLMVKKADKVKASLNGRKAAAKLNKHASNTYRPGKVWEFGRRKAQRTPKMKKFLEEVMREYKDHGAVTVDVSVRGADGKSYWTCFATELTKQSNCDPA